VLIDCDLVYESLHPRRARGIADFIIDKRIEGKENIVVVVFAHKILNRSLEEKILELIA
jgi:hypothetical protein